MSIETDCAIHDITYWAKNGVDDYGEQTVAAAADIKGRLINSKSYIERSTQGTVQAEAMLKDLDRDLVIGSIVWQGLSSNYSTATDLFEVVSVESISDVKGRKIRRSAFLNRWKDELPAIV